MNKVVITIALAAVVVAAYAVPVQKAFAGPISKAVNWTDVEANVALIEAAVNTGISDIKTVASNDNEQVGSSIGAKMDSAAEDILGLLEDVRDEITNESLNETSARTQIGTLKGTLSKLKGSLQTDLALLTPEASEEIANLFTATFDNVQSLAEDLYVLLGATPLPTTPGPVTCAPTTAPTAVPAAPRAINWTDVEAKVALIEAAVSTGIADIKAVASNDNEQVGSSIGAKMDAAASTILVLLQQVKAAISNEALTEEQARTHISTLNGTLARLIGSLQADLALLTPEASQQITDLFHATFDNVEVLAEDLYVLLGATPLPTTPGPVTCPPTAAA